MKILPSVNQLGSTVLHIACEHGRMGVLEMLLNIDALRFALIDKGDKVRHYVNFILCTFYRIRIYDTFRRDQRHFILLVKMVIQMLSSYFSIIMQKSTQLTK